MDISQTCPPKGGRFMEHSVDVTDRQSNSTQCRGAASAQSIVFVRWRQRHVIRGSSLGPQKSGPQTVSQDGQLNPPPLESQV